MNSLRGLLLIFLISHFLCDYYFQTEKLAKEKEESFRGVIKHFGIHFIFSFFCLY